VRAATIRRLAVLALAAGSLLRAPSLHAQAIPADTAPAEVLLQLRIDGGPVEVISALASDTVTLLPVRRFLELAEVRIAATLPGRRISGELEPGHVPYAFDLDSSTVSRGGSVWRVAAVSLAASEGELYASTGAIGAALGIDFQADYGELVLVASHTAELPVVRRLAREQRRRTLLGLPAPSPWEMSLPQERRVASGAVLDWGYTGALTDPVGASLLQLGLGAQLLGGSLELQYAGQQSDAGGATDVRSSWSGVWPGNRWLRQLRLGDIVPGARRGRVLRGVELTNAPYLRPAAFGNELLYGSLPPGWDMDLYQDQQLLGYASSDESGRYALDVPIRYGANPVEILAYGPNGEVVHRRRTVQVPFDRLPAGRFEYAASGGACSGGEPCRGALSLSARYGINRWLTAETGSDNFWRDSLPDLWHPYALISAAASTSTGFTFEGVARGFVRARADFDPTPDFHLDLEHTRFASGVSSPLIGGSERERTDAVLFWRPRPVVGNTFVQLVLSHARFVTGSSDAERLALTTRVADLRLVAGVHHRRIPVSGAAGTLLGVDAVGDLVLRGPGPVLRSLFVRGDLSLETSGLSRLGFGVGRQLAGPLRLDVGTGWTRGQQGMALDLALTTDLPGFRGVSRSRYTAGAGIEGTNVFEGSATYDGHLRRVELGNGRLIGRARVVGRVFQDLNGDGHQSADEPGVVGVRLRVGSRGVTTDSLGRYSAWDLVPFEATSVEVDTLSINDPLWVPAALLYHVVPGPNAYDAVDIALLPASEASGRVVLGDDQVGVGGVAVVLRHLGSGAVSRVTTFSDGSFYAIGLRPGAYEVGVTSETLDLLHASQTKAGFTVNPGAGATVDGIALRLIRADSPSSESP
jgi:hypothetical protein